MIVEYANSTITKHNKLENSMYGALRGGNGKARVAAIRLRLEIWPRFREEMKAQRAT